MKKIDKKIKKAVKKWCKKNNVVVDKISHIYPRAYVLCKAAGQCLYVVKPIVDAEPQIQNAQKIMDSDNGDSIRDFHKSLKTGSWCSVAYVSSKMGGFSVAIPAVSFK